MNDLSDQEEKELNPPPKPYKVAWRMKIGFLVFAVIGMGMYALLLADRRMTENRFVMHQDILPVKLAPSPMPPLSVIDPVSSAPVELRFVDDKYTLLNIWATWCPPCQKEMPSLGQLSISFKDKLRVIALSVDDDEAAVKKFIAEHKLALTVLWDHKKKSIDHLGIDKYPETFLISPDGKLITQFSGPRDWGSPQIFDYFLNELK